MKGTEIIITFLGTGSSIPPLDRQQSSFAIRHQHGLFIFDCGEGTQYSIRKYNIPTRKELVICISHLHSDHFLGLPGLLASLQLLNREDQVTIIGPFGTNILVKNLLITNFVSCDYKINIIELKPGDKFQGRGYKLISTKALHEARALSFIWKEDSRPGKIDKGKMKKFGLKPGPLIGKLQKGESINFKGKIIQPEQIVGKERIGRVIAYSGDTFPNQDYIKLINENCDILIHEGTYPSELDEVAKERGHSTIQQVVSLVAKTKIKKLVFTHFSPRITNFEKELNIARTLFEQTEFAHDGYKIILEMTS